MCGVKKSFFYSDNFVAVIDKGRNREVGFAIQ